MDSLYSKYIQERQGLSGIWKDYGFITYRIVEKECYLADMFIEQIARLSGQGRRLLNELHDLAEKNGCDVISANIHLLDPNANCTLRAALACGFQVTGARNEVLVIEKKLGG